MTQDIANMRIRFYGVQGSDSVYPDVNERAVIFGEDRDALLKQVFLDLTAKEAGAPGQRALEALRTGDVTAENLRDYRETLRIDYPASYGGWTTCVHLETSGGHDIVFDCGTGFRNCALDLQQKWADSEKRHLYVLGSHSHIDHTIGFDQAAVCHDPRNTIHVIGNEQFLTALDRNLGIFTQQVSDSIVGVQTPLHYGTMAATFEGSLVVSDKEANRKRTKAVAAQTFVSSKSLKLDDTSIQAFEVFHPAPCLAYRVEYGDKSFVFCTDHELRHGDDESDPRQKASAQAEQRLREFTAGADLLYRDGQFQRAEYDGEIGIGRSAAMPRIDWGHSCIEDVVEMVADCGVRQTLIGHHDPNRAWQHHRQIDEQLERQQQRNGNSIQLARAEMVIDL